MPEILPISRPWRKDFQAPTSASQTAAAAAEQSNERGACSLINAIAIDEITIGFANKVLHAMCSFAPRAPADAPYTR